MKSKIFVILALMLFFSSNVQAWDGERKGFILGFGIGTGYVSISQYVNAIKYFEDDVLGDFKTDFKIGYAPSNTIQIYYFSKVSWFDMMNVLGDKMTIADGVAGIGVSYYFNETFPSWYIMGGIGQSSWATPFDEDIDTWTGNGIVLGGGYEFTTRPFNIEGSLTWGQPTIEELGILAKTKSVTFNITLNVTGY